MIKGSKQKSVKSVKSVRNKKLTRIARMTRMERLARREKGVPYGQEIEQIYSKSFKFVRFGAICVISREATPFNPMNLLNHPGGVCLYINKFLRNDWADGADVNGVF